jgi:CheY-like chemotaxis protein/HPt (histidine-containing phosphotransfer) domain-containing protein
VVSAPSGAWGLELARLNQPDIILLDLMMPKLDGREVVSRLRADPVLAAIPVIVVTIAPEKARGTLSGVEDYVAKPVEPAALKDALKRHLFPKRGKILVVDDDQFVTEVLSYALQEKGCEVRTAENGLVALDVLRDYRPDLIILDLMMPVMGGMAFLEEFKKHPRFPLTPIFVLTGKILTPQEIQDLEGVATRVMIKGEKLDVLLKEVFSKLPERRKRNRPKKTVVRVAPKLAHLIPGFLRNRRTDVESIRTALDRADFPSIQRMGHQLRGAGGGYGFTDLTDIGHRLEVAATEHNVEELMRSLGALTQYLDSVEVIYQ